MNRVSRSLPAAVAVFAVATLASGCRSSQAAGSDFDQYVASIRGQGMTEMALSSLQMIAAIRTRQMLVAFEKDADSGFYIRDYTPVNCGLPGVAPEKVAALKKQEQELIAHEVDRIRRLADADGSGFVTTEEGRAFRDYYETALLAAHICEHDTCTLEALAAGLRQPKARIEESLAGYTAIRQRAAAERLPDFPVVPL